ncbi:MAG TPA: ABC transporter permease [Actinomycetota bacterium]|nr:ABC transporter permease [Actinomycetota bacterium]
MSRAARILVPVIGIVAVVVLWDLTVRAFDVRPSTVPPPGDVFRAIIEDWEVLWPRTRVTMTAAAVGFSLGSAVGFVLAVLMSRWPLVRRVLYPVLIASQAIPPPAMAAPLVIILGFGLAPKIAVIALWVFFPVVVNVLGGLASVDRDLLSLARTMDGRPLRVFALIELPATVTPLFSALKLGAAYSATGAVIGDMFASLTPGLGNYLGIKNSQLDTDAVYAAVLLLTAIGLGGFLLMSLLERLATPWRTRTSAREWRRRRMVEARPLPVSEDVQVGDRGGQG